MADHKDAYELTPTQRAMLLYAQSAPESQAYFEQICYAFQGQLDVAAFAQAWQRVIDRHPILRTSFYFEAGQRPVQMVHPYFELPFVEHDWRGLPGAAQEQRLALFLEDDRRRGFDLARPPLIRLALIRTDEESYRFVFSSHHIIMDGWSMSLVRSEVSQFYKASKCGAEIKLEPARGFRDYVEWLRERAEADSDEFWGRELRGFAAPNNIAIDHAPGTPPARDVSFAERGTLLPTWLTADLQSFAGSHRLTMSTLIQGAWAVLLSRYCDTDDVVFGVTVSGRPPELTGIESMVGLFINIQPRRARICASHSVLSYFKNLQGAVVRQREHEYLSLDRIKSACEVSPSLPFFESLVVFDNFQAAASPLDLGAPMKVTGAHLMRTSYPLALVAHPGNQLRLQVVYHRSRFAAEAIETMLSNLSMMLEDMVENPDRSLESLELLKAADRSTLLVKWSTSGQGSSADRPGRDLRLAPASERKAG